MSEATHWPARFEEMIRFVDLSEEERQLIKASSPLVMQHARQLTDQIYGQFLDYPSTRQYFVTEDDKPDAKRIEDNKQTVISWLRATASAPTNEGFVRYLAGVSQMHLNTPLHRPGLDAVDPRYIIGTISFYQTEIAKILFANLSDADVASQTSIAWNKWLMLGLDMQLVHYMSHSEG